MTERLGPRDLAKFAATVALLAILADAAVGHALAWENDPYWTYWVTKTFLIATVFGLGTAWVGVGVGRGAAITAVHTVVLTVYYWSLSPIGLPSHPSWLDLEHTWATGVPIHFGVIYLGYLAALWVWRRRAAMRIADEDDGPDATSALAGRSLAVGVGVTAVMGVAEGLALGEFQGATWYVVRLLIVVPFLLAWVALAGRDGRSVVAGTIVLTSVLTSYTHFLGPVGLPDLPLRVFEKESPGATVHWLGYREEALVALPLTAIVVLAGLAVLCRVGVPRGRPLAALAGVAALLGVVGAVVAPDVGPDADAATITADGAASVERGPWLNGDLAASTGRLQVSAVERNPRVTPLPPHDSVDVNATIEHPDGATYVVTADRPMVDDPLGRYGTWWGVGFDEWHHGRSGIGTSRVPATHSRVALFAVGSVARDGQVVARGVPVHVMTMHGDEVELDVGDPDGAPLPGLPDGHLRAVWADAEVDVDTAKASRYLFGNVVLAVLLGVAWFGVRAEETALGLS